MALTKLFTPAISIELALQYPI